MPHKYNQESVDWNDSEKLNDLSNDTIQTANQYRMSRKAFADAKIALDFLLVKAYKDGDIAEKHSYEKALLMVVEIYTGTAQEEEVNKYYREFTGQQANYKGIEKLLEAKQAKISLAQSLIRNQVRSTT